MKEKNLYNTKLNKNYLKESYMYAFPIQFLLRFFFTSSILLQKVYSTVI